MSDEVQGLTRGDFYQRFSRAVREVLARENIREDREPRMVIKVNLEDSVNRLHFCPVCGGELVAHEGYAFSRSCEHGEFVITNVWGDGDVVFDFTLNAAENKGDGS